MNVKKLNGRALRIALGMTMLEAGLYQEVMLIKLMQSINSITPFGSTEPESTFDLKR